jgi:hypothetical protein
LRHGLTAHSFPARSGIIIYLVYAHAGRDGLYASQCTRTGPAESAAEDVMMLDALKSE